jgi:hypothetical protein
MYEQLELWPEMFPPLENDDNCPELIWLDALLAGAQVSQRGS